MNCEEKPTRKRTGRFLISKVSLVTSWALLPDRCLSGSTRTRSCPKPGELGASRRPARVDSLQSQSGQPSFASTEGLLHRHGLLVQSHAKVKNVQGKAVTPILARGLLMLRLASASTASLLAAANVSKSDLEFWWSPLGTDLGLWDSPADIETFSDLWTDVADARDDADAEISAIQGGRSVRVVAGILARDVSLTQFSRAPMWLLGLD